MPKVDLDEEAYEVLSVLDKKERSVIVNKIILEALKRPLSSFSPTS